MRLKLLPHVGDGALSGNAHHLGEPEGRRGLNQRRDACGGGERVKQVSLVLADDVIDQVLRARGKHETRELIDDHERKADRELFSVPPDQLSCFGPRIVIIGLSFLLRHATACALSLGKDSSA